MDGITITNCHKKKFKPYSSFKNSTNYCSNKDFKKITEKENFMEITVLQISASPNIYFLVSMENTKRTSKSHRKA